MALEHERGVRPDTMIDKVHAQHWDIAYRYGDDCFPEDRVNAKALTAAVTEALQIWLQPLRDYAQRPLVNDFRYRLNADLACRMPTSPSSSSAKSVCQSFAATGRGAPEYRPARDGTDINPIFMSALVHEMGHIFGLADTYLPGVDWGKPELDKGGTDSTKGTQPSLDHGRSTPHTGAVGYSAATIRTASSGSTRRRYEGLGLRDCFFPDYELEKDPLGCRAQVHAHLRAQARYRGTRHLNPKR